MLTVRPSSPFCAIFERRQKAQGRPDVLCSARLWQISNLANLQDNFFVFQPLQNYTGVCAELAAIRLLSTPRTWASEPGGANARERGTFGAMFCLCQIISNTPQAISKAASSFVSIITGQRYAIGEGSSPIQLMCRMVVVFGCLSA